MGKRREAMEKTMTDLLDIPKDLVLNLPRISLVGNSDLYLENHQGIIEYSPERMRINLCRGFLEIEGSDLEIKSMMTDEMQITGVIRSIKFVD